MLQSMRRWIFPVAALVLSLAAVGGQPSLRTEAVQALGRATAFFRSEVSTQEGYLWRYSEDLSLREGERRATATMVWVQPPGTPSVGMAYLEAYKATHDRGYLEAARQTALALVRGQLRSGGWDYVIEFDPALRHQYSYRVDPGSEKGRNVTTLDDDTTQAALRLLVAVDQALELSESEIHEAALYALDSLLAAQYPNGAWPQRFVQPPDPSKFPVKRAGYPQSWPRLHPGDNYRGHYTFNDGTIADTITTMLEAARVYRRAAYRQAAEKAGGFILLAQMPEPQPAWAQQYDAGMHPAWARRFEPPSVTGGESLGVMRSLLELYRETGSRKYLAPLPSAIAYLRRSRLSDGGLARFYELETNRPLYFTRDYRLTYADDDLPTHYAFKVRGAQEELERIAREYERLGRMSPSRLRRAAGAAPEPNEVPEERVREIIAALDARGRWVEPGELRTHEGAGPGRIITTVTFIRNVRVLTDYLRAQRN